MISPNYMLLNTLYFLMYFFYLVHRLHERTEHVNCRVANSVVTTLQCFGNLPTNLDGIIDDSKNTILIFLKK